MAYKIFPSNRCSISVPTPKNYFSEVPTISEAGCKTLEQQGNKQNKNASKISVVIDDLCSDGSGQEMDGSLMRCFFDLTTYKQNDLKVTRIHTGGLPQTLTRSMEQQEVVRKVNVWITHMCMGHLPQPWASLPMVLN